MSINAQIKETYSKEFEKIGSEKFFESVFSSAKKSIKNKDLSTEIIIIDQADSFFALYRKTGNENYSEIAKILRKVAHKIYRIKRAQNGEMPTNRRFLELV